MKVIVRVVKDTTFKGKWMVEIRYAALGDLIGIPIRGVSKAAAHAAVNPVWFAFEFGVKTARTAASQAISSIDVTKA